MKKLFIVATLLALVGAVGCDDDGKKVTTGIKISASLEVMTGEDTFFHETKIYNKDEEDEYTLTHEFTTFGEKYTGDEGKGWIYVIVWGSDEDFQEPDDLEVLQDKFAQTTPLKTGTIKSDGGSSTIGLDAGEYYVLVMYDYKDNGDGANIAGKNEFYKFHDGEYDVSATSLVTVTDGEINDLGSIVIENEYKFQKDAEWYEAPTK